MLKLKKIGITGGVASGKSSVCQIFQELGAFVVDADAIVHQLLDSKTDLGKQIIQQFGPEIIIENKISRKKIAEKVFTNRKLLDKLEKLLHPEVEKEIERLYEQTCPLDRYSSFVVEIPLLFEIQKETFYDCVIAVIAKEKIARKRFVDSGHTEEEYDLRMQRQLAPEIKAERAHYMIENSGSLEDLKKQVIHLNNILNKANFA